MVKAKPVVVVSSAEQGRSRVDHLDRRRRGAGQSEVVTSGTAGIFLLDWLLCPPSSFWRIRAGRLDSLFHWHQQF